MKDRGTDICSLLEKKLSLFEAYLSVTEKIKDAFGGEGKGNPGVFIAERQGLIDRIEKIDYAMDRVVNSGESQSGFGGFRETIETRLQEIKALMERVKPMDEALIAMVREAEEESKGVLLKMRKSRQAVNGYHRMEKSTSKFFDELR